MDKQGTDRVRIDHVLHSPEQDTPVSEPAAAAADVPSSKLIERFHRLTPQETASPEQVAQRDETRIRMAWAKLLWLLTFLGVLLAVTYFVPHMVEQIQYASTRGKQRAQHELAVTALRDQPLAQLSHASQLVSQRVVPSVVHITTQTNIAQLAAAGGQVNGSWQFAEELHGQGSGFIIDKQGYIVTNFHVVKDVTEIEVLLSDGRRVLAEVVGEDPPTDLALLKINADGLIPAEWGPEEEPEVGSMVWAVGSPFGLQRSVTSGIISGKHRTSGIIIRNKHSHESQPAYQDFLQTDAVVNPGNSGGPLVDTQGRVIGVNTAIAEETYRGVVFSIPSQVARPIVERLKEEGQIRRGWLGVELAEVDPQPTTAAPAITPKGAVVRRVIDIPNQPSPASIAGIQEGDVVVRWNGREVTDPTTLRRLVAQTKIGGKVPVQVQRQSTVVELEVAVGVRPPEL